MLLISISGSFCFISQSTSTCVENVFTLRKLLEIQIVVSKNASGQRWSVPIPANYSQFNPSPKPQTYTSLKNAESNEISIQ